MIEALKKLLSHGQSKIGNTKDALSGMERDPLAAAKSLRTQLMRFSLRVHRTRRSTITGQELRDYHGFVRGEWSLSERIAEVGSYYEARLTKRSEQ
jgi:hypothetical protein